MFVSFYSKICINTSFLVFNAKAFFAQICLQMQMWLKTVFLLENTSIFPKAYVFFFNDQISLVYFLYQNAPNI